MKQWAGRQHIREGILCHAAGCRDKNIISANGTAALEFAREVLLALKAAPEDKITDWYNFHKQGYYEAPMPEDAMEWNN